VPSVGAVVASLGVSVLGVSVLGAVFAVSVLGVSSTLSCVSAAVPAGDDSVESSDSEVHAVAAKRSSVAPVAPMAARRGLVLTDPTVVSRRRRGSSVCAVFSEPSRLTRHRVTLGGGP
jgi:hypothetical protein